MTESFCLYKLVEITKLINKFSCESNHKKKKKNKIQTHFQVPINHRPKNGKWPFC